MNNKLRFRSRLTDAKFLFFAFSFTKHVSIKQAHPVCNIHSLGL